MVGGHLPIVSWLDRARAVLPSWQHRPDVFQIRRYRAGGTDLTSGTYNWLDLTARGRQEDWEQPPERSDSPLMGWLRHHDSYGT